jgi:hypothetical protein
MHKKDGKADFFLSFLLTANTLRMSENHFFSKKTRTSTSFIQLQTDMGDKKTVISKAARTAIFRFL